jgi:hypothetical protein
MKQEFLTKTKVSSISGAMSNSIQSALQRNPTYLEGVSDTQASQFRNQFATKMRRAAEQYPNGTTESLHLVAIQQISSGLSTEFAHLLNNSRLRIGTSQKAFNLYLKFLWCLDSTWPTPPHCPIDARVLQAAGIPGAWTKLDSIEMYETWIAGIRTIALHSGAPSIAEWELGMWNNFSTK